METSKPYFLGVGDSGQRQPYQFLEGAGLAAIAPRTAICILTYAQARVRLAEFIRLFGGLGD